MTGPAAPLPPAGLLRDVALGDVAGLAADSAHNHLGLPSGVTFRFESGPPAHVFISDPSQRLVPGDTYLFTVENLLTRWAGVGLPITPLLSEFLQALGRLAAATTVTVIGLLPLAWDVPQKAGTVTVPAPTTTTVKRPRLPPGPPHIRLTWRGAFVNGASTVEEWDFSLKTTQPVAPLDGPALLARAHSMVDIFTATVAHNMQAQIVLTQCIYAVTDGLGKVQRFPDGAYVQGKVDARVPGSSSVGSVMPLQTALCVSLGSARPGATGRGRFFLPWQDVSVIGTDFRIDNATATVVAGRAAALVSQVNALGQPVIINSSKGTNSPVTSVKVGRVLDTMRSRREKVVESYVMGPALT